ncbi:IS3 family transposase, partial [Micromonospora chersina]
VVFKLIIRGSFIVFIFWGHEFYCFNAETFYINNELNRSNHIVIDIVEKYIKNYNNNRIQQKLGYLSPVKYRELIA